MYQVLSGLLSEVDFHLEHLVDDCQTLLLGFVRFLICLILFMVYAILVFCQFFFCLCGVILILVSDCLPWQSRFNSNLI